MTDYEWRTYDVPPWRRIKLPGGRVAKWLEDIMRRRAPDRSWQYREMTDIERAERQRDLAW